LILEDTRLEGLPQARRVMHARGVHFGPGVYQELVRARLALGWSLERAVSEPVSPRARVTVSEVRKALDEATTSADLASALGVSARHARGIRSRRRWKTV